MIRTQHFHCQDLGSIPDRGTKISQAKTRSYQKKKKGYSKLYHYLAKCTQHESFEIQTQFCFVLSVLHRQKDCYLSFLTRDWTCVPDSGSKASELLNHQGIIWNSVLFFFFFNEFNKVGVLITLRTETCWSPFL